MKAFFTGLGLGAAVGLLLAPKSGSETRNDITEFARESYQGGRDRLQDLLEQISRRTQATVESVDGVREQASEIRDQVREKVDTFDLMSILNDWPHERLIEIDGIGPVLATEIIQNRPYRSEEDLIDSRRLPPSAIESLRNAA